MSLEQLKKVFSNTPENLITESVLKEINTLFEASVASKISTLKEDIRKEVEGDCRKELVQFKENLINKMDIYFKRVVKEFTNDNRLVIESKIKTKILETAFNQIKDTLVKNNINLTERDSKILKKMEGKTKVLEQKLNEEVGKNIKLSKKFKIQKYRNIFENETRDLSMNKKEQLKSLMESIEFENGKDLKEKIKIMRKNFLGKTVKEEKTNKNLSEETLSTDRFSNF